MANPSAQDTRPQLLRLLKLGGLAMVLVAGVSLGALSAVNFKVSTLTEHAAPAQLRMTRIKSNLDALVSLALRFRDAQTESEMQTLDKAAEDLAPSLREAAENHEVPATLRTLLGTALPTFDTLRTLSHRRLADQRKAQEAAGSLRHALEGILASVEQVNRQAARLAEEAQGSLVGAREANQKANRLIQQGLSLREKLGSLENLVGQVAVIEKNFKLSPHKEKIIALFDNIFSLDLAGLQLTASLESVKFAAEKQVFGEDGLFALRKKQIKDNKFASGDDGFQKAEKDFLQIIEDAKRALDAKMDPIQLSVTQEAKKMTAAVSQMALVRGLDAATTKVLVTSQALQTEAEVTVHAGPGADLGERGKILLASVNTIDAHLRCSEKFLDSLPRISGTAELARKSAHSALANLAQVRKELFSLSGALPTLAIIANSRKRFDASMSACTSANIHAQDEAAGFMQEAGSAQLEASGQVQSLMRTTPPALVILCALLIFFGRKQGLGIIRNVLQAESERKTMLDSQKTMVEALGQRARELEKEAKLLQSLSGTLDAHAGTTLNKARGSLQDAQKISSTSQEAARRITVLAGDAQRIDTEIGKASMQIQAAVASCQSARKQVTELQNASGKIGDILKLITGISKQIHMLSLNATIEAERAGDAGRGFAVLANHVRGLARRTADSAVDIRATINGVQDNIRLVMSGIEAIHSVVDDVNGLQANVSTAAASQLDTTRAVNGSVVEAAASSGKMSAAFEAVAQAAGGASTAASQTREAATRLENLVHELTRMAQA